MPEGSGTGFFAKKRVPEIFDVEESPGSLLIKGIHLSRTIDLTYIHPFSQGESVIRFQMPS